MHRATPLNSSFRAYSAGGARSVVDKVDDTKLMQEMGGNFMANETRKEIEAAQNYGFTSVVFDAEKDGNGKVLASAECFMSFIGGNRSFPAAGPMDDRRHRMFKLDKGDTAMFRGRGDKQQFHMTDGGGFWSAPQNKTVRMQLVPEDSESNASQQQGGSSGGGASAQQLADGGGSGASGQQGQQKRGQEAIYKKGQDSHRYVDITKDSTTASGTNVHLKADDKSTYVHVADSKDVWLGAEKGKGSFDKVATLSGPCVNTYGKIG
ncbi:phage gp45-like [Bradyrhizobium barranii subsp. barranii]|uniref:phage baseplate assembly protein domain-containing protein n=1 Tax=Bradyrhizobium liaoningense TaxID=43992 RepID=UPI001BA6986D|nr:phage baseplate assembly protein [Bradyrhizobium liaoningense]MBR0879100.1 phage baseplate assembly protein [Bradyrhizobium liaoningense]